jgi:hypothetical protein
MDDPLDAPLWVPTRYTGQRSKRQWRSILTDSGRPLILTILADSCRILMYAIGSSIKFPFHFYKERPKRTAYAT